MLMIVAQHCTSAHTVDCAKHRVALLAGSVAADQQLSHSSLVCMPPVHDMGTVCRLALMLMPSVRSWPS